MEARDVEDPAVTLALLKQNAVVGVTGFFDAHSTLQSLGIQCAWCHSTVDDTLAPNVQPFVDLLGVDDATVREVLNSWGPGKARRVQAIVLSSVDQR